MEKDKRTPWSVRKKMGILSTAITLVVVCCLALLNLAAAVITDRYPVKWDLTANQAFQLSQNSIDYLEGMQKEVTITVLNTRDGFLEGGDYYRQAMAVLEQYAQYNRQIHLEFVDLMANPAYIANYPDLELAVNDLLISCGENLEQLTVYDLFEVQYSWYGGAISASNVEQAVTGAILNVSTDPKKQLVFVTGHQESDASGMQQFLERNGFEAQEVSTLLEELPQEADLVVLYAPHRDLTVDETEKLDAYLENGGNYGKNVLYFAAVDQPELPNLSAWLAKWGMAVGTGAVAETSPSRVLNSNGYFGIAEIAAQPFQAGMQDPQIPLAMPFSRPVEFLYEESLGRTTTTLLSYSETAGVAGEDVEQISDIVPSGPIAVAGMSTYTADNGAESNLLVFGSDQLFSSQMLGISALSNADYLMAVGNTLTHREGTFFLPSKTLGGQPLIINQAQALLLATVLMVVLPVAVLAVGIVIWMRRRRA